MLNRYLFKVQFSSVAQSCLTPCDPMNCSMPGLPVHHQLPEFTQTRVHWVAEAIQPSHPLPSIFSSCPQSLPASGSFQMNQLFASGGQSIGVSVSTPVLPMNTQDWSPLGCTGWISLQSEGLSQESSPISQFKSINSLALRFLYSPTLTSIHEVNQSEIAQSCPTLCDPMECSQPGSSLHGIFQARILEWVSISFSRGYSWPRDRTQVSRIPGRRFNLWATREAH